MKINLPLGYVFTLDIEYYNSRLVKGMKSRYIKSIEFGIVKGS